MDPEIEKKLLEIEKRLFKIEHSGPSNAEVATVLAIAWEAVKFIREVLSPKKGA